MKNIFISSCIVALSMGIAPNLAHGAPGEGLTDSARLEILGPPQTSCPVAGGLCLSAGAATLAVPSSLASAQVSAGQTAGAPMQFTRAPNAAGRKGSVSADSSSPWNIEMSATLRRPALAGNALFLVYDAEDPAALAAREVTALWQTPISAGNKVAARLSLSPEDGFHPAHSYLIRIVQIVGGQEVVLAEGEARLL